eukprot:gene1212-39323_t
MTTFVPTGELLAPLGALGGQVSEIAQQEMRGVAGE